MNQFLWTESCASTQDLSKSASNDQLDDWGIASDEAQLIAFSSRQQFAGRGRGGSAWVQGGSADVAKSSSGLMGSAPAVSFTNSSAELIATHVERFGEVFQDFPPTTFRIDPKKLKVPMSWLPLLVGCAVVDALEDLLNFFLALPPQSLKVEIALNKPFQLKWPNDVLIKTPNETYKKVCGILCETSFLGTEPGAIHVGVGLNLMKHPNLATSTSLLEALFCKSSMSKEAGRKQKYLKLIADKKLGSMLTQRFFISLQKELFEYLFVNRARGQLRGLVLERSVPKGTHLIVNKGERQGSFVGLDLNGALLLDGQSQPILAGDVALGDTLPSAEDRVEKLRRAVSAGKLVGYKKPEPELTSVLCLDLGNTRIHWRLDEAIHGDLTWESVHNEIADSWHFAQFKALTVEMALRKNHRIVMLQVSVVAFKKSSEFMKRFEKHLRILFPEMKCEVVVLGAKQLLAGTPLEAQYQLPTLGADRALRFWHCWKTAAVNKRSVAWLSLGTANTLECVSADGQILESWIGPGLKGSLESLHASAAKLPLLDLDEQIVFEVVEQTRPCSTEQSIMSGVLLPLIKSLCFMASEHDICELFISGGNAKFVSQLLGGSELNDLIFIQDELLERKCILEFHRLSNQEKNSETVHKKVLIPESEVESFVTQSLTSPLSTQALIKSLRRGRVVRAEDLTLKPTREHFRRLGLRIEGVAEGKEPRIDRYLAEKFRFHNRETWRQRVLSEEVLVQTNAPQRNAFDAPLEGLKSVKDTYRLKNYDLLWLFHPPEYEPDFVDSAEVVYDDGDAMVFSKPGNLVVHASGLYGKNTFVDVINRMGFGAAAAVHRLDRETSGALVCARTTELRSQLALAFRESRVKKMYLAVTKSAEDRQLPKRFMVRKPIGPALKSKIRLKLWVDDHPDSQDAATAFECLASWNGYHLWACFPVTGRTNQIRIHLASLGEWIVGDKMYHPNEDVFITFYEEGLTSWVLKEALFHRHLLHNAGVEALGNFPHLPVFSHPIAVPLTEDVYDFLPAVELLKIAGISQDASIQKEQLVKLFSSFCWNEIQTLESVQ
jgi:23S rRNA-/tRNA-specific pseudouridylate synthase/biotin-(acetyl-CoA carboxylase) ligase/pantothenate kinase type III